MTFKPRYELHTEFGVIDGSYEELVAEREKFTPSILYEILPSSMNKIRVSRVSYVTYGEYANIHKLYKGKRSLMDIAVLYNIGWRLCKKIINDDFAILCR